MLTFLRQDPSTPVDIQDTDFTRDLLGRGVIRGTTSALPRQCRDGLESTADAVMSSQSPNVRS
jgi:hypothetical protein